MSDRLKPIMFLDIDDTLLCWTEQMRGRAAPEAAEFIRWALRHFEVRWMTAWAIERMSERGAHELVHQYHLGLSSEEILAIPTQAWRGDYKTTEMDVEELQNRGFVWVEDELLSAEKSFLERYGWRGCFYRTNVSLDRDALVTTKRRLCDDFNLPN